MIKLKRIYQEREENDGVRVLVDRIWPRGISKEKANLDLWLKEVAPSTELRKFFGHDPKHFAEFSKRYSEELTKEEEKRTAITQLKLLLETYPVVTLVYGAKDEKQNQAVVLKEYLERSVYG